MTNTLTLAARLRSLDDARLREVIAERRVSSSGIHDFFDLAEALLERESVQRALGRLERDVLAAVAAAAQHHPGPASPLEIVGQLVAWGADPEPRPDAVRAAVGIASGLLLVDDTDRLTTVYDAVHDVLAAWPQRGLPSGRELAASAPPVVLAALPGPDAESTDRLAAERAFSTVIAVSGLLAELSVEPAHELQKGGLALPSVKRLSAALSVSFAEVPGVLSLAARAGLACKEGRLWLTTDAGTRWQHLPSPERWSALATAWHDALPPNIGRLLAQRAHTPWGDGLRSLVSWSYPANGDGIQERVSEFTRDAELVGLTAAEVPSTPGTLLLEQGIDAATRHMEALFPPEGGQVYLQHDLSIVAPGPLTPSIDARLRTLAEVEGRALAFSYRVSESSVNHAIAAGETAEGILRFLDGISLTGIPQPLEYLVTETARRYGRVRVGAIASGQAKAGGADMKAHSYVRSADADVLHTLEVDQSLAALGFARGEHQLVSRFARDEVFWALTDARYPVAAEDSAGDIVSLRRSRTVHVPRPETADSAGELIGRLRSAATTAGPDAAHAWLARQLDIAVRGHVALVVSVVMPDGRVTQYALEPTGVGGGRLRGRDRLADIERTLPLSSITGIRPAEDDPAGR